MSTTDPTDFVPPEDEGFSRAHRVETRRVTSGVPPELADRFSLLRVLQTAERPSQAVVLRVRDLRSGDPDVPLVLKWYHRMHAPGPDIGRTLFVAGRVPPGGARIWNTCWKPDVPTGTRTTCTGRTVRRISVTTSGNTPVRWPSSNWKRS